MVVFNFKSAPVLPYRAFCHSTLSCSCIIVKSNTNTHNYTHGAIVYRGDIGIKNTRRNIRTPHAIINISEP